MYVCIQEDRVQCNVDTNDFTCLLSASWYCYRFAWCSWTTLPNFSPSSRCGDFPSYVELHAESIPVLLENKRREASSEGHD